MFGTTLRTSRWPKSSSTADNEAGECSKAIRAWKEERIYDHAPRCNGFAIDVDIQSPFHRSSTSRVSPGISSLKDQHSRRRRRRKRLPGILELLAFQPSSHSTHHQTFVDGADESKAPPIPATPSKSSANLSSSSKKLMGRARFVMTWRSFDLSRSRTSSLDVGSEIEGNGVVNCLRVERLLFDLTRSLAAPSISWCGDGGNG